MGLIATILATSLVGKPAREGKAGKDEPLSGSAAALPITNSRRPRYEHPFIKVNAESNIDFGRPYNGWQKSVSRRESLRINVEGRESWAMGRKTKKSGSTTGVIIVSLLFAIAAAPKGGWTAFFVFALICAVVSPSGRRKKRRLPAARTPPIPKPTVTEPPPLPQWTEPILPAESPPMTNF